MSIKNNTTSLQNLLNAVNALPEAGGELPVLTNPGTTDDLLLSKQLIDGDGNIVEGTIPTKASSDLTVNGATVTTPAGYYAVAASKTVATATQVTPSIAINSDGLITATATQAAGYVSAGTKSSTYQLAFQAAKTITPNTVSQIAVSSGYYTGGNITVAAVPTQAKSVTPTASTQNIIPDSGKFLSKVTVIGDNNLVASNIKSGVSIFGVSGTAEVGGEINVDDVSKAIIDGTIIEVKSDDIEKITSYALYNRQELISANFPICSKIGEYAFARCEKLTTVNFPECLTIDNNAFWLCGSLVSVSFPVCISIGMNIFSQCSSLATVNFPMCTSIPTEAFRQCINLISVSFPVCSTIGRHAFSECSKLTTVDFPSVDSIAYCAFQSCVNLTSASFSQCLSIDAGAFCSCFRLSSLTLGASSICYLDHLGAFDSTPFDGFSGAFSGTPYIYVPSSLVEAYKSATNWVYYSSYFRAIGSSPEDSEDTETYIITFTVNDIEYQAENSMTWEQFINSQYNTDHFTIDSFESIIMTSDGLIIFNQDFNPCSSGDLILNGAAYIASM